MADGLDKYLEEQRRRLQSFGDFVGGINRPAPKPQGQSSSGSSKKPSRASQTASLYNTVGKSSRNRHSGRLRQAEARRRLLSKKFK